MLPNQHLREAMAKWSTFKERFNKAYASPEEETRRFNIFAENLMTVKQWNHQEGSEVFGVTKFSDMTPEEFKGKYLGYKKVARDNVPVMEPITTVTDIPSNFNWADEGAVTPVYNQEQCGSCWAFSATEEIESMYFMKYRHQNVSIKSLSMQQIIDCDKGRGDEGCNGGDTPTAYAYVMAAGGLELFSSYPYAGVDQQCKFDSKPVVDISAWNYVTQDKNESAIQVASYANGPVSICVDAASWQFYIGGIIRMLCGQTLDHCVQITGWGLDGSTNYWIIRNSWGADWGESGYLKVEMGKNLCGVADEPTQVTAA
jgi:cathepsin F